MSTAELIRSYARQRAQECIEDWALEDWYEGNDTWGTDFTDDELLAIAKLAAQCVATLPEDAA